MSEKVIHIDGRIAQKCDTEANWIKNASDLIPMSGEMIIYQASEGETWTDEDGTSHTTDTYKYDRVKLGDGKTKLLDLPFVGTGVIVERENDTDLLLI